MERKLVIGQRLQVTKSVGDTGNKKGYYPSRIEEKDSEHLYISEPLDGTVPVFLRAGHEIEVIFSDEKGTYLFRTTVLGRTEQNIRLIKVAFPENIEKTNRRGFFRLKVFIPFAFRLLPSKIFQYGFPQKRDVIKKTILSDRLAIEQIDQYEGVIKDLSGGGALAAIDEKIDLKVGDHLEIWLPLGKDNPLYLWADVVRISKNPEAVKWNKEIGIYFSKIDERDRDKIILHVLSMQRELLQRGALDSDQ